MVGRSADTIPRMTRNVASASIPAAAAIVVAPGRAGAALAVALLVAASCALPACSHFRPIRETEPPAKPFLNGTDLDGWVRVNCWDDTFQVRDGMLYCTGQPTGFLRSERMYEDFELEFDWKHESPNGNAGLFVWSDPVPSPAQVMFPRSIEVQIMHTDDVKDKEGRLLYTGQGDVFSIWGATMTPLAPHPAGWERTLPSARVTKPAGEWNHYKVTGRGGDLTVEINGTQVSGCKGASPRKGYICLESEGSPIWFRNMVCRSIPPAAPAGPREAAMDGNGMKPLFDGRTLAGWKEVEGKEGHWRFEDRVLRYDGKGDTLWSTEEFDSFELVVDWRWTKDHQGKMMRPLFDGEGNEQKNPDGSVKMVEIEERDSGIYLRGSSKAQVNIWSWPVGSGEVWGYRTDTQMAASVRKACTPRLPADRPVGEWNRFVIRMIGDRLNVWLNGQHVILDATLPLVPARGPIALQSHGCPIEFQNAFVRRIEWRGEQ